MEIIEDPRLKIFFLFDRNSQIVAEFHYETDIRDFSLQQMISFKEDIEKMEEYEKHKGE